MKALMRMVRRPTRRPTLPLIRVPTLILHREGDRVSRVQGARYIAERIRGAKYVELPGIDHFPWVGDSDVILDESRNSSPAAPRTGARPGAGDGHVHPHRRGDGNGRQTRRSAMARSAGPSRRGGPCRSWPTFEAVRSTRRRRLPGGLRRAGPSGPLRRGDRSESAPAAGFGPGFTPGSARRMAASSAASPWIRARGCRPERGPARCWCRAR